ncbi:hypothetical protein LSCM1_03360 [Leishmania martiniquensis]|uniref:Uncharacterized protein n=1 Tax=Leishmania martiniquensis TaxID=1580590 RepID=A0A836KGH6_9TRYP|nr:hypothetical protein LSCM1_03360 [Leishmania martiniquensis]
MSCPIMCAPRGEYGYVAGEATRSPAASPSADMLCELTSHVARSAITPYGARMPKESADSALLKQRMELLKTVAAIRANEDTFGLSQLSRHARTPPQVKVAQRDKTRKPFCPPTITGRFKAINDLKAEVSNQPAVAQLEGCALGHATSGSLLRAATSQVIDNAIYDPRKAVAEKHKAALITVRPRVPTSIEESIVSFNRSLGAVKPYAMSRSAKLQTRYCFTDLPQDSNERYVERMQCCRPFKGLYSFF